MWVIWKVLFRELDTNRSWMWRVTLLAWWLLGSLVSCCPQDCRCFTDNDGYKVANCSKSGLIAAGLSPTIDVLNFKNQLRGTQTKLEARIFGNFRGVKYLNLQNSSISHLPNDVFLGLPHVSRINLSFNKIKHLNGVVFKPLRDLIYLSLRGNFLSISPLEVIVSNTLEELDMGHCSLANIPLYTFSSTPRLSSLILDGNFIHTLEYNVLPNGLHYLNLASNNIVEPPINIFNSLRLLVRLDISNNPINCSCSLLVFQDTLSGRAGLLENGVICNNPPHLFGKKISDVNENQLCQDDYMNREGINNWAYSRKKQGHYHIHNTYGYQSDEPLMGDESYGSKAAEVMFTNDETNQMGTHMETAESSLTGYSNDDASSETEFTTSSSKKESDSAEMMEQRDLTNAESATMIANTDPETADGNSIGVSSSLTSSATEPSGGDEVEAHSTSREDNVITLYSSHPSGDTDDHSNTLHAFDVGVNDTEPASPTESLSDIEQTSEHSTLEESFTLPTSATEPTDYSYDAQHDDYGILYHATSAESTGMEDSLNDLHLMSSSTDRSEFEGSGEEPTGSESSSVSIQSVSFLEDHETETEPSLQTVSDDLVDVSSSTISDVVSSSTDASSTSDFTTETSTEPMILSSIETSSVDPSTEASSLQPTTDTFGTSSTDQSSPSEDPSSGSSTELPTISSSLEPSSSTEPTIASSSSGSLWWESEEEMGSPSSSAATAVEDRVFSSSVAPVYKKGKSIEFTTESTRDNEVEVDSNVGSEKNEPMKVDTTKEQDEKNLLSTGITFIIIGLLIAFIMILLTIILCRRKKSVEKIRLPTDPEASAGTELRDMLLPQPSENGIKVLPKYTNGSTLANGKTKEPEATKEEQAPVLVPEPDPEEESGWNDKPEPIEAVTARLTMLARPQTPVFIQKMVT